MAAFWLAIFFSCSTRTCFCLSSSADGSLSAAIVTGGRSALAYTAPPTAVGLTTAVAAAAAAGGGGDGVGAAPCSDGEEAAVVPPPSLLAVSTGESAALVVDADSPDCTVSPASGTSLGVGEATSPELDIINSASSPSSTGGAEGSSEDSDVAC